MRLLPTVLSPFSRFLQLSSDLWQKRLPPYRGRSSQNAAVPLSFAGLVLETDWPFFSLIDARPALVATAETFDFANTS